VLVPAGALALFVPLLATAAAVLRISLVGLYERNDAPADGHRSQEAKQGAARTRSGDRSGEMIEAIEVHAAAPCGNGVGTNGIHRTVANAAEGDPSKTCWLLAGQARKSADTQSARSACEKRLLLGIPRMVA
jgi:hypothetical protein